jgi:hypothetical protein
MFKKIKNQIYELGNEIERLNDHVWQLENPYGIVKRDSFSIYYKLNRKTEIYLGFEISPIKYKIKKSDNIIYVIIEVLQTNGEHTKITYLIQNENSIKIESPIELNDELNNFDLIQEKYM